MALPPHPALSPRGKGFDVWFFWLSSALVFLWFPSSPSPGVMLKSKIENQKTKILQAFG
jgi:hypothetical protein